MFCYHPMQKLQPAFYHGRRKLDPKTRDAVKSNQRMRYKKNELIIYNINLWKKLNVL